MFSLPRRGVVRILLPVTVPGRGRDWKVRDTLEKPGCAALDLIYSSNGYLCLGCVSTCSEEALNKHLHKHTANEANTICRVCCKSTGVGSESISAHRGGGFHRVVEKRRLGKICLSHGCADSESHTCSYMPTFAEIYRELYGTEPEELRVTNLSDGEKDVVTKMRELSLIHANSDSRLVLRELIFIATTGKLVPKQGMRTRQMASVPICSKHLLQATGYEIGQPSPLVFVVNAEDSICMTCKQLDRVTKCGIPKEQAYILACELPTLSRIVVTDIDELPLSMNFTVLSDYLTKGLAELSDYDFDVRTQLFTRKNRPAGRRSPVMSEMGSYSNYPSDEENEGDFYDCSETGSNTDNEPDKPKPQPRNSLKDSVKAFRRLDEERTRDIETTDKLLRRISPSYAAKKDRPRCPHCNIQVRDELAMTVHFKAFHTQSDSDSDLSHSSTASKMRELSLINKDSYHSTV